MRIPDEVLDCVMFVGIKVIRPGNREVLAWMGTAFIVGFPVGGGSQGHYVYLVTARHVVDKIGDRDFFIRGNTREGVSRDIWIRHDDPSVRWWFHPSDEAADIAISDMELSGELLHFNVIQSDIFLATSMLPETGIGIGDEVFIAGLFGVLKDTTRNFPVVRVGNIAMMPPEPISTGRGKTDAYLIEACIRD